MNQLGEYLERIRKEKKLSLREAAEKSGVSYTYIRDIELGINRKTKKEVTPSVEVLKKIADAYHSDYFELLEVAGVINENMLDDVDRKLDSLLGDTKTTKQSQHNLIPLIGTICAGSGLLAEQNIEDYVHYPFPGKKQPDYALLVKGDSMKNIGIEDGDIVYMKYAPWAEYNGQVVAAIINDSQDGTLKRMRWSETSSKITLIPENDSYETIEVSPNEVSVCGLYMGHFKVIEQFDI